MKKKRTEKLKTFHQKKDCFGDGGVGGNGDGGC
jgi:hypothetical protein